MGANVEPVRCDRHDHWDWTCAKHEDFFGTKPNEFGLRAARLFQEARAKTVSRGQNTDGYSREQLTKTGVFLVPMRASAQVRK